LIVGALTGTHVAYLALGVAFIVLGCATVVMREKLVNRKVQRAKSADARVQRWMWIAALWIIIGVYWLIDALH